MRTPRWRSYNRACRSQTLVNALNWNAVVKRTDVYRFAITRTFASLYSVSPSTIDASWTTDSIVVRFADKTFVHTIIGNPDDEAPKFTCVDEDPVTVFLTYDEY